MESPWPILAITHTGQKPDTTPAPLPIPEPKKRIFVVDGRQFPDPNEKMTVEEVRQHMTDFFPELANAETETGKSGKDDVYTFKKRVGTKRLACLRSMQSSPSGVAALRKYQAF